MAIFRSLARGLRHLTNPAAADRDVDEEVRHYFEEAAGDLEARGMRPDEARRAVRLQLGDATLASEDVRAAGWEHVVLTVAGDLAYAARRLRRSPGFTAVSVATLAVGIGATTIIFGAIDPILLRPLPYPHAERIAAISDTGGNGARLDVTFGTFRELLERGHAFEALSAMKPWTPTLSGAGEAERLDGQRVTFEYFAALGVPPRLGRDFQDADDRPGAPAVAILSDGLWRRRFGGDAGIIGRTIRLDGAPCAVVGVMPAGFENVTSPSAEIWTTLQYDPALPADGREWGHHLQMIGRVSRGVTIERARQELNTIAARPVEAFHRPRWAALGRGLIVTPLQDQVTGAVRPALLALVAAVLLVLGMACVNVVNLLLARGAERRGELAVRAALGASRPRVLQQLLVESLLLAAIGGGAGVLVAFFGVRALVAASPVSLPRTAAIAVDGITMAFATALTAIVGITVGVVPALQLFRAAPQEGLQHASLRSTPAHRRLRRLLTTVQVALAAVVLVGSGLLVRSLVHLLAVNPGFDPAQVLTMQIQVSGPRYADGRGMEVFFTAAADAVRRVPGVESASFVTQLPLAGGGEQFGVAPVDETRAQANALGPAYRYSVLPGYVETMKIPILGGRSLTEHDRAGTADVALVSNALAKNRFGGRDPIGQRLRVGGGDGPPYTVVGIVGDVKQMSLAVNESDAVYVLSAQSPFAEASRCLVVRGRGDVAALAAPVKAAIWSVDKDQPISRLDTLDHLVARTAAERRFVAMIFELFALAAILLAAVGIYGVLSGGVTERTREIGLRAALGATPGDVLGLVARDATTLAAGGLALGLVASYASSRILATLLFGISRFDPVTYAGVSILLLGTSVLAAARPAWRAAHIDPTIALKLE